jgi:acyl-CoA thioesterase I
MRALASVNRGGPAPGVLPLRRHLLGHALAALFAVSLLPGCASPCTPAEGGDALLVVGDSLSAGYGLQPGTGWVWLLEPRLAAEQVRARVVNVSVTGETTVMAQPKMEGMVKQYQPSTVVIEMGSNDTFGGIPLSTTSQNLSAMVKTAQAAGAQVLLISVKVPSQYGATYQAEVAAMYSSVATTTGSSLLPNLLAQVTDAPDADQLFQKDQIHPNEQAQPILLANVWPELRKLLK